ncbi:MAG: hypothetical protein J6M58_05005 [Clostridium sp.]|nr:hypothetical protein [Clostridium sp.]MBO6150746.1 hypothetical protein [Clostridium sp.]MBP3215572.1 hypothetical protein [Clostridium sp.]
MIKKLCPICDHVMTTGHFCTNCRSFVRHPNIIDADYYLNETHPPFESDCDFHNPAFAGELESHHPVYTGTVLNESGNAVRKAKETLAGNLERSLQNSQTGKWVRNTKARNKNPIKIIMFILMFYVIMLSVLSAISAIIFG